VKGEYVANDRTIIRICLLITPEFGLDKSSREWLNIVQHEDDYL